MLGDEDEWMQVLERAFHWWSERGESLRAARCAFWIGMNLALRGEMGPATGWLGRAQRLLEREETECVEHGYMLLPVAFQHEVSGDLEGASATAAAAAEIAERFGDSDLFALAVHVQGTVVAKSGRVADGLGLLDEAMVAVTTGEVSPVVCGIVYCGVILACEEVYEVRRAQEWTAALTRWCEQQPDLISFRGRCLVHRAQLLRLHGEWPAALDEARLAGERFAEAMNPGAIARAWYLQGDLQRLTGRFEAAEASYREASRLGLEPQPGLALVSLREACRAWQELGAPYELAVARVLLGRARRLVGDEDGFELELDAARAAFQQLGAAPSVASVDALTGGGDSVEAHGLTSRELEVLRLVAKGKSNR